MREPHAVLLQFISNHPDLLGDNFNQVVQLPTHGYSTKVCSVWIGGVSANLNSVFNGRSYSIDKQLAAPGMPPTSDICRGDKG
jgi:hypothetical protein